MNINEVCRTFSVKVSKYTGLKAKTFNFVLVVGLVLCSFNISFRGFRVFLNMLIILHKSVPWCLFKPSFNNISEDNMRIDKTIVAVQSVESNTSVKGN